MKIGPQLYLSPAENPYSIFQSRVFICVYKMAVKMRVYQKSNTHVIRKLGLKLFFYAEKFGVFRKGTGKFDLFRV